METFELWFEQKENDNETVLHFLKTLSFKISELFNEEHSNYFITLNVPYTDSDLISELLFRDAFEEATLQLQEGLKKYKEKHIFIVRSPQYVSLNKRLEKIGFTKKSLELKIRTLNFHWKRLVEKVNSTTEKIIDFSVNPIVKLVRKLLSYLNSILGSLAKAIPSVEAIKEMKEVLESYLGVAEELKKE